jgi:hypothetical protein
MYGVPRMLEVEASSEIGANTVQQCLILVSSSIEIVSKWSDVAWSLEFWGALVISVSLDSKGSDSLLDDGASPRVTPVPRLYCRSD